MNERGTYGRRDQAWSPRGRALVGITLFHGISDRDSAAAQLDAQIKALARAVVTAAGANPALITTTHEETMDKLKNTPHWKAVVLESREAIERSPYRSLWDDVVSPLFNEWIGFYQDKRHWYDAVTEIFTSWEDYGAWFDRVEGLRRQVQARGIGTSIPPLHPLHKSAQEVAEGAASDVWKMAKYGLYGVLAIGAVVALSSVAANLRKGEDPAQKWFEYAGRGARAA